VVGWKSNSRIFQWKTAQINFCLLQILFITSRSVSNKDLRKPGLIISLLEYLLREESWHYKSDFALHFGDYSEVWDPKARSNHIFYMRMQSCFALYIPHLQ
jgi:hypothetical protein